MQRPKHHSESYNYQALCYTCVMSVDNKIMSHHSVKCSFRRHFAQSDNLKIWWVFKTFCFFFHLSFVHICRFWRTHSKGRFSTLQSLAIFHLKYWWIRPNIRAPIRNILVRMLLFDLAEFINFHSSQRLCELDKMFSVQSEKKTNLIWNYSHFILSPVCILFCSVQCFRQ